jgi:hypothetical protein
LGPAVCGCNETVTHYAIGCSRSRKVSYRIYLRRTGWRAVGNRGGVRTRPCPFLDSFWRVAFLLTWPWIAALACADIRRSESRADGDTSGMTDRSPIAHTNKIPTRDRTESCVPAGNQRTIRRMPAERLICSARPCNENSIVNRGWLAGRRRARKSVSAAARTAAV